MTNLLKARLYLKNPLKSSCMYLGKISDIFDGSTKFITVEELLEINTPWVNKATAIYICHDYHMTSTTKKLAILCGKTDDIMCSALVDDEITHEECYSGNCGSDVFVALALGVRVTIPLLKHKINIKKMLMKNYDNKTISRKTLYAINSCKILTIEKFLEINTNWINKMHMINMYYYKWYSGQQKLLLSLISTTEHIVDKAYKRKEISKENYLNYTHDLYILVALMMGIELD